MLHRSSLLRVAFAAACLVTCVAPSGAVAQSAPDRVPVPAGAAVVAGPTASGTTLLAWLRGGRMCTALARGGEPRPEQVDGDDACAVPPILTPLDTRSDDRTFSGPDGTPLDRVVAYGITGSGIATVDARRGDASVARVETRPSPFAGAAGELRFYLVEMPNAERPDRLWLLDATGALRRVESLRFGFEGDTGTHVTTLARGRVGGRAWRLRTRIERDAAPTPLEPDRQVDLPCATFLSGGSEHSSCAGEGLTTLSPLINSACAPLGLSAGAITGGATRRLVAVLGDGRRRTVPLRSIPGAAPGTRAGVVVLGADVALRSLVALGVDGRVVERFDAAMAPVPDQRDCAFEVHLDVFGVGHDDDTPLTGSSHTLQVTDAPDGTEICVAADRAPRVPDECQRPGDSLFAFDVTRWITPSGRFVAALVTAEIGGIVFKLDDGTSRDVPATAIPGYSGRYAGVLRAVIAAMPGSRRVIGYQPYDTRGRILGRRWGSPEPPAAVGLQTIARLPDLPPLTTAVIPRVGSYGPFRCLRLVQATEPDAACEGGRAVARVRAFSVTAQCAPRRIVVTGLLAHATDRLYVRLAGGGLARARVVSAPAAGGMPAATAAVAVLGPGAAPRALVIRGRASASAELVLPPARQQCGYEDNVQVDTRRGVSVAL